MNRALIQYENRIFALINKYVRPLIEFKINVSVFVCVLAVVDYEEYNHVCAKDCV